MQQIRWFRGIAGGDAEKLMAKLTQARDRWAKTSGALPMITLCYEVAVVIGDALTTGKIKRNSTEKVLPNTLVEFAMKNGLGCNASHYLASEMLGHHASFATIKVAHYQLDKTENCDTP